MARRALLLTNMWSMADQSRPVAERQVYFLIAAGEQGIGYHQTVHGAQLKAPGAVVIS